jgi:peptidoglycan/xylan/chitin deacetylase (PgdA/CDA1 family)
MNPKPAINRRRLLQSVRSAIAPSAKTVLRKGGVYSALRRVQRSRYVAILRYHAICEPDAGYADPSICISPAAFEEHVAYLARNYAVLPLTLVVDALREGKPLPPNAVAITFDDGYADNLAAARLLHQHGCSATFYITTGCMADGEPFWPAETPMLIDAIKRPFIELREGNLHLELAIGTAEQKRAAVRRLAKAFKSISVPGRESLREQLRAAARNASMSSPMLTWDQIREMRSLHMIIGAHTVTHPNLPSAGLVTATEEIRQSKARLEQELDEEVTMFSYPNGGAERYFTRELQEAVREAGYASAVTSTNGFAGHASDLYALERVRVAERLDDLVFALEVERFAFKPRPRAALAAETVAAETGAAREI